MYKCHKLSKSCRLGDPILHKPSLEEARFVLVMIFILHFTDLMHNYQSNRSALLTRCGTDLCYQYGILGSKSQTSFLWDATQVRSKEGRLFSQAKNKYIIWKHGWLISKVINIRGEFNFWQAVHSGNLAFIILMSQQLVQNSTSDGNWSSLKLIWKPPKDGYYAGNITFR